MDLSHFRASSNHQSKQNKTFNYKTIQMKYKKQIKMKNMSKYKKIVMVNFENRGLKTRMLWNMKTKMNN